MKQASNVNDTLLSKNVAMFMPNDACMHMYMYVCMFVCMYVCMYVRTCPLAFFQFITLQAMTSSAASVLTRQLKGGQALITRQL